VPNQTESDEEVRPHWADALRLERHRRRLSQADVAEQAGVATRVVSKVEAGRGSAASVIAIAKALDVDLNSEAS
jgi:transcriptional regulator with XRE-family HTH domain